MHAGPSRPGAARLRAAVRRRTLDGVSPRDLPVPAPGLVVLAGGRSTRWGGTDKTAALLDGVPLLAVVVREAVAGLLTAVHPGDVPAPAAPPVAATPPASAGKGPSRTAVAFTVVVVAPATHPARALVEAAVGRAARAAAARIDLRWVREEPPGGGPVPGLAAGVAATATPATPALAATTPLAAPAAAAADPLVVLAGDAPFAGSAVPRLLDALGGSPADAAVGIDPAGRRQPLLAAYRRAALTRALDAALPERPAGQGTGGRGPSLHGLLATLRVREVPVTRREALDLDTPDALAGVSGTARAHPGED